MNALLSPQRSEWLAMTLLHSLWQAAAISILLWFVLRLIPAARPNLRYLLSSAALLTIVVSTLVTWWWLNFRYPTHPDVAGGIAHNSVATGVLTGETTTWYHVLVVAYFVGVLIMAVRWIVAVYRLRLVRHRSIAPSPSVLETVERLVKSSWLSRRIKVLVTADLASAAIAGIFRPTLFLPAAMITGLSERQLEAVIAHEMAHIRRFDVIANFFQMLIETAIFFNPAIWWISRQVRMEREACCDAAGVHATGDVAFYSETLAVWAEQVRDLGGSAGVPVGAIGFSSKRRPPLLERIRRVLIPEDAPGSHFSVMNAAALFLTGLIVFGSLLKGTQVAVAFVDDLLSHEVIVADLEEKREKFGEERLPIPKEIHYTGPMTIDLRLSTTTGQPTTSPVRLSYHSSRQVENRTNSRSGTLAVLEPGEMLDEITVSHAWIHLLASSDDYAPVVIRDITPDKSGRVIVEVKLEPGFDGPVRVVDEEAHPVPDAICKLSHVLKYGQRTKLNRSTSIRSSGSSGQQVARFTSGENGQLTVLHASNQPNYAVELSADGFETRSIGDIAWEEGVLQTIVLTKALPIQGTVVDGDGKTIEGATIYELASESVGPNNSSRSSNNSFCKKDFRNPVCTTDSGGHFEIRSRSRDRRYVFLVDAGGSGYQAIPYVQPGDAPVRIVVNGPLTIRGTVSGAIERLRTAKNDGYELRYGTELLIDPGCGGDMSGRIPLEVIDGKATFELTNVVPGAYDFFLKDWHHVVRDMPVTESVLNLEIVIPEAKPRKKSFTTTERMVRLNFKPTTGVSEFRGRISIHSRSRNSSTYYSRPLDVTGDFVEFSVNAPSDVDIEMMDAPGFLFEDAQDLEFHVDDDSTEVWTQTAFVDPGGVIYGQLIRPPGADTDGWLGVSVQTATGKRTVSTSKQCDDDGRFFLDNLMYGSDTKLIARCGSLSQPLKPIHIDAVNPMAEVRVELKAGPKLTGRVAGSDGRPIRFNQLKLEMYTGKYDGHFLGTATTDRDGSFSFGMINPDVGEHFIAIAPEKDYAPAFVSVDASRPVQVRLKPGGVVEGRLLDAKTNSPIADAEVFAMLEKYRPRAVYACEAEAVTDAKGSFRFSNLSDEPYELGARIVGGVEQRTIVKPGRKGVELRVIRNK